MDKKKNPFMRHAIMLARENLATFHGGPFGAVIVKDGKIIGQGRNTVLQDKDPTAHAEVNAIRDACINLDTFHLEGCEIYSSCEPCPMCLGAIYWARIDRIWYAAGREDAALAGFDDEDIYLEFEKPNSHRQIPMEQIMKKEAMEIFRSWNNMDTRPTY
ncbi:MAG: nucleoside deaminase [Bacteroidales bacterium]|nr:nucleoside deaminase [Bacteroidales bacterium]